MVLKLISLGLSSKYGRLFQRKGYHSRDRGRELQGRDGDFGRDAVECFELRAGEWDWRDPFAARRPGPPHRVQHEHGSVRPLHEASIIDAPPLLARPKIACIIGVDSARKMVEFPIRLALKADQVARDLTELTF